MIGLGVVGWTKVRSGGNVHLVAPEGPGAGVITLEERAPLRHLGAFLCAGGISTRVVADPVLIRNREGEHGGIASVQYLRDAHVCQRDVALLVGDGFVMSIIADTQWPQMFDRTRRLVEQLASRARLWLGVRRRWVMYPPPRGWRGVSRGLDAYWYPPGFPRDPTRLLVFPAVPASGTLADEALSLLIADEPQSGMPAPCRRRAG